MSAKEQIDFLMTHHDEDLDLSVRQLHQLEPAQVQLAELRPLSWLINHVVGEQAGRWTDALALQKKFAREGGPPQAAWHRAVAAVLAGAPLDGWAAQRAFASEVGCTPEAARIALRLGVLQFLAGAFDLTSTVRELADCAAELRSRQDFGGLEKFLGPVLNNLVSALIERADATVDDADYRAAVTLGADLSFEVWLVAGDWVNWERAEYLRALTSNLICDWAAACLAASRALQLIDAHGEQDVDRAFLLLEQGRAQRGMGDFAAASQSFAAARTLAAAFDEASLATWFADRARIAGADQV